MSSLRCLVLLWILHNCIQATNQCSPPLSWTPQDPAERAKTAQFVIVGTVIRGPRAKQRSAYAAGTLYSATFRLDCVIKGPRSLPKFVNVSGFGSVPGLCTSSTALLNRTYIAFLKGNVAYQGSNDIADLSVHEVNAQEGTLRLRPKTDKTLIREIIGSVGRNVSLLPVGTRNSSKPGCSAALTQRATSKQNPSNDHCNLNHTKRRKENKSHRCRKRHHRLKTTQKPSAITTLESITDSVRHTSHATGSGSESVVDFGATVAHCAALHVKSRSWCLVLIFNSLVALVLKYHQTT